MLWFVSTCGKSHVCQILFTSHLNMRIELYLEFFELKYFSRISKTNSKWLYQACQSEVWELSRIIINSWRGDGGFWPVMVNQSVCRWHSTASNCFATYSWLRSFSKANQNDTINPDQRQFHLFSCARGLCIRDVVTDGISVTRRSVSLL